MKIQNILIPVALIGGVYLLAGIPQKGTSEDAGERSESRVQSAPANSAKGIAQAEPEVIPEHVQETFRIEPLDPTGELIEPLPNSVEEFFEDYLEIDFEPEVIELGRMLFHDTRLSRDNTISCASCHDLRYGGIDRAVTATGVDGAVGPINTPTVFNSAFNKLQFWDGRAADLEAQADGPPNAEGEMASNWEQITGKLLNDQAVLDQLALAFPKEDFSEGVDSTFWLNAIANFERTLITPNAPFDAYLLGDEDAISTTAKEGYQVFKDVGCIECHRGIAIGGESFQRLGRKKQYFSEHTAAVNLGRFNVTGNEDDKNVFKVPSLRNIAITGPYLHDGSQESLHEVIKLMAEFQLEMELTEGQVERIAVFLGTLTGEYKGQSLDQVMNTIDFRKSGEKR